MFDSAILSLQRAFSNSVVQDPLLAFCVAIVLSVMLIILVIHLIRVSAKSYALENEMYILGRKLEHSIKLRNALADPGTLERFLSVQSPKEVIGYVTLLLRNAGYKDTRSLFAFASNRVVRTLITPEGRYFGVAYLRRNQRIDENVVMSFKEDLDANGCSEGMIIHLGGARRHVMIDPIEIEKSYLIQIASGNRIHSIATFNDKGAIHAENLAVGTST